MKESRAKLCPIVGQVWSDGTNCFVITHEEDGDYDILWSNGVTERELPDMRDYYLAGEYRTIKDAIASPDFALPPSRGERIMQCASMLVRAGNKLNKAVGVKEKSLAGALADRLSQYYKPVALGDILTVDLALEIQPNMTAEQLRDIVSNGFNLINKLDIAAHNIKSDCDDEWKKTAVISLDRLASIDGE